MKTTYLADKLGGGPPEAHILGATAQDDETLIVRAGLCLATVVHDSFVPGAVVMLGSFRAHHPGFEGDVVVLHDGLSEASRTVLAAVGGPVRFEPVRPALVERVARLASAYPGRLHSRAAFHSLEAFRLEGYRKVLFYDSDVLFQGPVGELFGNDAALLCCGDPFFAMGKVRDAETLQPITRTAAGAGRGRPVLDRPFNSGFLLIDGSCTGERVYEDLLARMAPEAWRGAVLRFGDQDVLNRYFAGRQTLASWTYNYFVPQAAALRARTGLDAAHAKALHFKGPVKPWTTDAMLCWAHGDDVPPAHRPAGALFRRWYDAYVDVLARAHLRAASPALAKESVATAAPEPVPEGGRRRREGASWRMTQLIPGDGAVVYGATCDVERAVTTHLFGIGPNNSGSTFLQMAMVTCRGTWNLPMEGLFMPGFAGPSNSRPFGPGEPRPNVLWAADRRWLDRFADPDAYDWPRTRKAWYFQAYARDPEASVFYTKSPPHLVIVDELARHFRNAKFLFTVRDPYATCEGIIRTPRNHHPHQYASLKAHFPDRTLPELAAIHVATCLAWQRRNVEAHGDRGVFFTYEAMCAEPERVEHRIRTLVPALDDLRLRQRLPVKRRYHEMLTDMNARQIARLDAAELAECTRVFRERRDVLDYFGYDLR